MITDTDRGALTTELAEANTRRHGPRASAPAGTDYFYGEPVDVDALTAAWQTWLTGVVPAQ